MALETPFQNYFQKTNIVVSDETAFFIHPNNSNEEGRSLPIYQVFSMMHNGISILALQCVGVSQPCQGMLDQTG